MFIVSLVLYHEMGNGCLYLSSLFAGTILPALDGVDTREVNYLVESFWFESGTVLEEGAKLPKPCVEITTKFEAYDRLIDREEALEIANISGDELDKIIDVVIKADALIEARSTQARSHPC